MIENKNERNIERKEQASTRKEYVRPEVVKHGNVESLTQGADYSPSCPIHFKLPA